MKILHVYPKTDELVAQHVTQLMEGMQFSAEVQAVSNLTDFQGVFKTFKPDIVHCQGWMASLVPVYLKTAYADEPCFRDCRVVYTVTDNLLTKSTGNNFANILAYKDAGADCVKEFPASLTPNDLQKLAIKYSDAVTFATLKRKPSIETYASKAEKTVMSGMKDIVPKEYLDFFDEVWSKDRTIAVEED